MKDDMDIDGEFRRSWGIADWIAPDEAVVAVEHSLFVAFGACGAVAVFFESLEGD